MAQDYGDYTVNYWLNYLRTSKTVYAAPSTTYPALDGTNVTECAQGDYARPLVSFNVAANRAMTSSGAINFVVAAANASGSAGPFAYMSFWDAVTGGNFLGRSILTVPLAWVSGSQVAIAGGDINFTLPST